jgi:hypothetical protein
MRPRKYMAKIALTLVVLGAIGSITVAAQDKATSAQDKAATPHNKMTTAQDKAATAQDKYTIAVPGGLAFSEFRGYEGWQLVSISHNGELIAAILANPVMIDAYRAGIPGNGQPFPDGAKMAKIHWKPTAMESFPTALVPDVQHDVDFMVKDSKRFADSGGWGWAVFEYDAASDKFRPGTVDDTPPQANDAKCGFACHTIVESRDYVFTNYGHR